MAMSSVYSFLSNPVLSVTFAGRRAAMLELTVAVAKVILLFRSLLELVT